MVLIVGRREIWRGNLSGTRSVGGGRQPRRIGLNFVTGVSALPFLADLQTVDHPTFGLATGIGRAEISEIKRKIEYAACWKLLLTFSDAHVALLLRSYETSDVPSRAAATVF